MPKRAVFERSRRELSLDASVGVHILLLWSNRAWKVSLGGVPRLRNLRYYCVEILRDIKAVSYGVRTSLSEL